MIEVLMLEEQRKAREAFEAITALEEKLAILVGTTVEVTIVLDGRTGAYLKKRLKIEGFLRGHEGPPEIGPDDHHLKIGQVSVSWPSG